MLKGIQQLFERDRLQFALLDLFYLQHSFFHRFQNPGFTAAGFCFFEFSGYFFPFVNGYKHSYGLTLCIVCILK